MNGVPVPHKPTLDESHKIVYKHKWFVTKMTPGQFVYGQRLGCDSIAFVLVDEEAQLFGVVHEFKDPIAKFITSGFGGSIDDVKYHSDLRLLVMDEVIEESGFTVDFDDVSYHGAVLCSTQSNEFVHLFSVDVDRSKQGERTTTNPVELQAEVRWLTFEQLVLLDDWRAITIAMKRRAAFAAQGAPLAGSRRRRRRHRSSKVLEDGASTSSDAPATSPRKQDAAATNTPPALPPAPDE